MMSSALESLMRSVLMACHRCLMGSRLAVFVRGPHGCWSSVLHGVFREFIRLPQF